MNRNSKKANVIGPNLLTSNKHISDWVIYMRKQSLSPVLKFAKDHNISSSLVKKYESGEYDEPSPLIASNFCKHFAITPKELVDGFILSNDSNFDKDEYLQTLNSYYYNSSQNTITINSIKDYIDLETVDQYPKLSGLPSSFNIPFEVVFQGKHANNIVGAYFKYEKVHKKQRILEAYHYLANSIANASLVRLNLKNSLNFKAFTVKNYLFVVSSRNAFEAIYKERNYFYTNNQFISPVNIILLLLPKYNSKNYHYFVVNGEDFLKESDHYYTDGTILDSSNN